MPFCFKKIEDKMYFYFPEDMDTLQCLDIEDKLIEEVKNHGGQVVFDMHNVEFIASSFIRLCGETAKIVGSENLKLIYLRKHIKAVLKKVGLASVLNIE